MRNIWQKLVAHKKQLMLIALLIVVLFGGFLLTSRLVLAQGAEGMQDFSQENTNGTLAASSSNDLETWVLQATGTLASWVVTLLGKLLTVVIGILISIAQYNGFISSPVVTKGWVLIRDICNMFFVVILIIMAFGTVFQKEQYSYKRLLASMVFAAVLVNFSKAICGIIIDFSQIIMLTFINAVKSAAAGNFAEMIGLRSIVSITVPGTAAAAPVNFWETVISYGLAEILLVVALVVFTVITIIILLRIIQLWFLVILSPLAFLATVGIPRLSAYSSKWWDKFGSQVIIGPVLAVFLWLSLAVVADAFGGTGKPLTEGMTSGLGTGAQYSVIGSGSTTTTSFALGKSTAGITATVTEIGHAGNLLGFIVGIAMLVASLSMAQEMGVAGGALAGKAASGMKNFARGATKGVAKWTGGQADMRLRQLTGAGGRALSKTKFGQKLGLTEDFQGISFKTVGQSLKYRKQLAEAEEKRKVATGAQVMGQGLYQASHAGFWTKQVSQNILGQKRAGDKAAQRASGAQTEMDKIDAGPFAGLQKAIDDLAQTIKQMEGQKEVIANFNKDSGLQAVLELDDKKFKDKLLEFRDFGLIDNAQFKSLSSLKGAAGVSALQKELGKKDSALAGDILSETSKKTGLESDPTYKGEAAARDNWKKIRDDATGEANKYYSANFFGASLSGLGYPEKEDLMAKAKLEKVNEKLQEMKERLPVGDEDAYIGELLKRIAAKDGAGIEAALKLVYSVNGHNTLGANASWHAMAEPLLEKRYGAKNFAAIKSQFDSERSNHVFLRDTIDELLKKNGSYGNQQSIRVIQQLANIGSGVGNHSMVGAVHTDAITGQSKLVDGQFVTNKITGKITLEAPEEWKMSITTRNSQIESQKWATGLHINTLANQDASGRVTDFHEAGYSFLMHDLTPALMQQFNRLRSDTRDYLWDLKGKVSKLISDGSYTHSDGTKELLSKDRIDVLQKYISRLQGLTLTGVP